MRWPTVDEKTNKRDDKRMRMVMDEEKVKVVNASGATAILKTRQKG